ncbi:RNA polymerase sigma factor [Aquamicrobium ahrensii]|uniref:RNA polymerase sigma-70 factor (ECF subfamily) n=1 Tax=Aquamicrobium ahrensii TaxID=469551 RepID=A0ABV2KNI3_9HYPH
MTWNVQELFRRHACEIARALRRRGLSEDVAADLTQDTFLRVLANPPADTVQNHNPRAYLFEVSRNLSINHYRRQVKDPTIDVDGDTMLRIADPSPSVETAVYSRQMLKQVAEALDELPQNTREAFILHRIDGMTVAEVGRKLGLSSTRAWELVHRAYKHLLMRVD